MNKHNFSLRQPTTFGGAITEESWKKCLSACTKALCLCFVSKVLCFGSVLEIYCFLFFRFFSPKSLVNQGSQKNLKTGH